VPLGGLNCFAGGKARVALESGDPDRVPISVPGEDGSSRSYWPEWSVLQRRIILLAELRAVSPGPSKRKGAALAKERPQVKDFAS
jgi:hypothetical protein